MKRSSISHRIKRNHNAQSGAVLIIVLWIAAGLVTVALLFGQSMMFEYRISENSKAGAQAEFAVESAARYATHILENLETSGSVPDEDEYYPEAVQIGESLLWMIGRNHQDSTDSIPEFGLIDEGSKLNINTATVEMLEALPGMTEQFAAAIIDWRDEDDEVTENGAEADAYAMLNPSYQCKNAPFETVFELRMVYQADDDVLFGEDANLNGLLDPNESDGDISLPSDNRDGALDAGLFEYVTVYSRVPNTNSEGEARVNINGDDDQALTTLFTETFGSERGGQITTSQGQGQDDFTSLLQFYMVSGLSEEEFAQIETEISISDDEYQPGLINVNTASAIVLACVPGIDESQAQEIASQQADHLEDNSVAWVKDILGDENTIQAGPYLTGQSYQFTVDAAAVGRHGRGFRRTRFVIDLSEGEAKIVYRRDLSGMGWALGERLRRDLMQWKESAL
ncbi:MAG: type II secretion system protein GspK [Candidatus Hinthialibacter antarcticus]|nr:type II secretion system protein GspK [Candidatus Hinthialibacter antarcticus]